MKRLMFLAAAGIVAMASCQNSTGYVIKGTIEGADEGSMVYLQDYSAGTLTAVDSAVVKGGKFSLAGEAGGIAECRFLTYVNETMEVVAQVFLEKGTIKVDMSADRANVGGTTCNDAYQKFMNLYTAASMEINEIYTQVMSDSTLTDAERAAKGELIQAKEDEAMAMIKNQIADNIDNVVGVQLLASFAMSFPANEIAPLLEKIPAELEVMPEVVSLKEYFAAMMKAAEGQQYSDIELNDPDGNAVKLSDYIPNNKYTLVDFWASWCGPCRMEMPNVVAAYEKYKAKGFGIVGISLDSDVEAWKKAITDLNITWPQMSDLQGWQNAAAQLYGVRSIPSTLLIDQSGVIVARDLRGEALLNKLAELF